MLPDFQNAVMTLRVPDGARGDLTLMVAARDPAGSIARLTFTINVVADASPFADSTPFLSDAENPSPIAVSSDPGDTAAAQLHAKDADGGPLRFVGRSELVNHQTFGLWREPITFTPPGIGATVTSTGQFTVLGSGTRGGVFPFMVGVTNQQGDTPANVDTQVIPVYVTPPKPMIRLLSDTGLFDDNLTSANNSSAQGARVS